MTEKNGFLIASFYFENINSIQNRITMKTLFLSAVITACFGLMSNNIFAQKEKPEVQKKEEIIIKKDDAGPSKMTIEMDSNRITINGKPISAFNGDVTVLRRNFLGGDDHSFSSPGPGISIFKSSNKAFLGVLTAKVDDGAIIKNVVDESSAKKAGLEEDDIITRLGDKDITSPDDLRNAVGSYQPGDEVTVNYLRAGKKKTVQLALGKAPANAATTYNMDSLKNLLQQFNNGNGYNFGMGQLPYDYFNFRNNRPSLGLKIEDTKTDNGVKVLEVQSGSPAAKAGVKVDDIITEVNGEKTDNVNEVRSQIMKSDNKNEFKIKAKRGNMDKEFDIHIPKSLKSIKI